ncbi:ATP-dependent sacrificial sulfur transferase LarE [Gemmatimonadota bacterium]
MAKSLPILDLEAENGPNPDRDSALGKLEALRQDLAHRLREGVLVAFSGGMDSAFLLWASHDVQRRKGGRLVALTTVSPSTPEGDRDDAGRFAEELGVDHVWRESGEVSLPEYSRNDRERCYHCKAELFRIAGDVSREMGVRWLLYGYNASDHEDDRPGHRAAREGGVLAPLSDAGLTKAEIRLLMKEEGLSLADKPASPCLSSRIMTGIEVTPEKLQDVQELESILRRAGVSVFRVRVCDAGSGARFLRVEVDPGEMESVLKCREELQRAGVSRGYRWVTLDLGGYRTGGGVA